MSRLLQLKKIAQNNFKLVSSHCSTDISIRTFHSLITQSTASPCLACKLVRMQSTTPNLDALRLLKKKKPRKKASKKFTELLQVTDKETTQTKTSVQKLKANQLTKFIETPLGVSSSLLPSSISSSLELAASPDHDNDKFSIEYNKYTLDLLNAAEETKIFDQSPIVFVDRNLNELKLTKNNLQTILESYQTFKTTNEQFKEADGMAVAVEPYFENEIEEELFAADEPLDPILEELTLDDPIPPAAVRASKKSKKKTASPAPFKSKYHKTEETERQGREKALAMTLTAYIDVCVTNGMLNRGMHAIQSYRYRSKRYANNPRLTDIGVYNILLHGYAEKGNFLKIMEILQMLAEDKMALTHQSFAAIFECLGRVELTADVVKKLEYYKSEAAKLGYTLNDIVEKSKFVADQREMLIDGIRRIDRKFVPRYTPPALGYSNNLLDSLNENVQPIERKSLDTSNDGSCPGSEVMASKMGFERTDLEALGRQQLGIELAGYMTVPSIEKFPEPTKAVLYYRKKLEEVRENWRQQIIAAYNRDIYTLRCQTKSIRTVNLLAYLRALDVDQYADILLREIQALSTGSDTYTPTVGQLYRELGRKVEVCYHLEQRKRNGVLEKSGEIYSQYCDILSRGDSSDNPRQCWQRLVYHNQNDGPTVDMDDKAWTIAALMGVGKFLYQILMRDIKIDANVLRQNSKTSNLLPAFYTLFRNHGKLVKEEVKPHPVLTRLYRASQEETITFDANLVPMLCPPVPWNTSKSGGYLTAQSELIRLPHQAVQQLSRLDEMRPVDLYPALDSLNQLASIPWNVNTDVLDVILEVFNSGGNAKLDVPSPPSEIPSPLVDETTSDTPPTKAEKFEKFRQRMTHRRKQAEMYSLRCDALYRLSLANHYRDKVFWLPHNMDFRGRVYPIPPHLNHIGSDLARCLLVFHQPKPLGIDGFNWLKLHCINLTGLKKRDSVRERLLYAEEVMDEILDSADNPLDGRMWWAQSDEPWQTLACCMEIAKVKRSGDPENFMSRLPIHQDGSCNGLQHYAALGRDSAGAISVNLAPSDIPQDVYSLVANLVEEARQKDADRGMETAKALSGYVKRKVIKQTVMTTVYGVTRYGARLQIARQLKDIDEFPKELVWSASSYLTNKTFESLREMFTSTKEIQDWFTECARLISAVCGQNVEWVTPLGLPVVQPYNRHERRFTNKSQSRLADQFSMDQFEKPNILKQKNAFPPNFIHSLDSSHMMLTSLHCERAGLTFVSVHDCFWTHACTVPDMNAICRNQFVALHSQPILEDLSKFLVQKYSYGEAAFDNDGSPVDLTKRKLNRMLHQLPAKGDFDLDNVLKSVYFFS